ncbi:hypothetical protein QFZ57_001502 [Arthrobacter sp. B1I2]|nr:hypothetical protein [Arthrobacter sp. B1I2]
MRRGSVLSLGGTALLAAVLLGGASSPPLSAGPPPQSLFSTSPPTSAPVLVPEPAPAPIPPSDAREERAVQASAQQAESASPPARITYAAVGMDQAVLPLSPTAQETSLGSIVPPPTTDAYWLTPYGMPGAGSTNTTYIVGHSWEGLATPFNEISTRAKTGDLLTVTTAQGPLVFTIDKITTEYKDTLKDSAIWDKVPGGLVLITCYTEDLWGTNIIIQASPIPTD